MSAQSKLIVKLHVAPEALAKLKGATSSAHQRKASRAKAAPSAPELKTIDDSTADNASESNATPIPADSSMAAPANPLKRKGVPGPKPGHKRMPPAISVDGVPKPRGKPGPKKRKIDGEAGSSLAVPVLKLGPKANQGAINEKLRALDRSGKPCRKWSRKPFGIKSFTGVVWGVPSWHGLAKALDTSMSKSEEDSSDHRPNVASSAVGSEDKSNSGNDSAAPAAADFASSPMPEVQADTPVAAA
ncbi:hypothetical protein FH972_025183 [Carpinus fangiana]|uniref:INO80 complex subunit 4 n=1 Tax=Carpinus fangiana TaxID=176857 RepID=A0A5N6L0I2_9ROSI|nr:hypothetical protein FH972_025183 [Carpinus fangiana]